VVLKLKPESAVFKLINIPRKLEKVVGPKESVAPAKYPIPAPWLTHLWYVA